MKIFTKTVRVLGVTNSELDGLMRLIADAKARGRAEIQTGPNQYLAVEVDEGYAYREKMRDVER